MDTTRKDDDKKVKMGIRETDENIRIITYNFISAMEEQIPLISQHKNEYVKARAEYDEQDEEATRVTENVSSSSTKKKKKPTYNFMSMRNHLECVQEIVERCLKNHIPRPPPFTYTMIYRDIFTDEIILSDKFKREEIQNGMLWEVQGKWVVPKGEDEDDESDDEDGESDDEASLEPETKKVKLNDEHEVDVPNTKVVDIIDTFYLETISPCTSKIFAEKLKEFLVDLGNTLQGEKRKQFIDGMDGTARFLFSKQSSKSSNVKLYTRGFEEKKSLVFSHEKEGVDAPTFLYFAHCLKPEQLWSL